MTTTNTRLTALKAATAAADAERLRVEAATAAANVKALQAEADLATLKLGAAYLAAVVLRFDAAREAARAGQPAPAVLTGSAHWEIRYDDGTVLEVRARKDTP